MGHGAWGRVSPAALIHASGVRGRVLRAVLLEANPDLYGMELALCARLLYLDQCVFHLSDTTVNVKCRGGSEHALYRTSPGPDSAAAQCL
jgi:hypothetical protein